MPKTDCYAKSTPYVTQGVQNTIPMPVQMAIWCAIAHMPRPRDYLQVFDLSRDCRQGKTCQIIRHSQEEPLYYQEYAIPCPDAVDGYKLFAIDEESGTREAHCILMLAEEW